MSTIDGSLGDQELVDFGLNPDPSTTQNQTPSRSTPVMTSTPHMRTPTFKQSAKFGRTKSSSSRDDQSSVTYRNLIQGKLLITQAGYDDDDDDIFEFRVDGRMSRDTDYETDLEMDYADWIAEDTNELPEDAAQDQKYIHMCNETGTIPVSFFIKHIKHNRFRMRYRGLGPLGAKAIAYSLKDNNDIEIADLEGNWMEKEGAIYMAEALRENLSLTDLNIAENQLGREGADAICEALFKNETLKSLNMSGNDLQDYGAVKICEMLQKNTTLKHLYLTHNKFDDAAAFCFRDALSHNENLETLDLSWNHFRSKGAVAIAEGVQENYGLKSLNVSMNGFSDVGAEALGKALKHNRGLTDLDLSHNRVTETGAGHIALGLQTNDTIVVLKMGYNPLGESGPMALLVAISKNDVSCLTRLDLSDIFVNLEFHAMQKNLESDRMISIFHAGVIMNKDRPGMMDSRVTDTFRRNPYEKIKDYVKASGYRLLDFFKDFDKDGSAAISREEFRRGVELAGIKITDNEIEILINQMDMNNDGMIDYSELIIGDREFRRMKREEEECPEDRQMQGNQNRFRRKESKFLEDIINS